MNIARLKKELADCKASEKVSGVSAVPRAPGNLKHLFGRLQGPEGTVYEGGIFDVDIQVPDNYPFEPPKMKFETKIWHPNVSSVTGAICLDILKDQWSPALTIKTALVSLQALLSAPEPTDPQDAVVAKQFLDHPEEFDKTARDWTKTYATPLGSEEKVDKLVGMGFEKEKVIEALTSAAGDENAALEKLLSA